MCDCLTDYGKSSPNNITCSNIKNISVTYSEIEIYNGDNPNPLQKYLFLINNVKVVSQGKNYIKIALSGTSHRNFLYYIDKLDNCIHSIVSELWGKNFNKVKSYECKKYSPIIITLNNFANCLVYSAKGVKIPNCNDYDKISVLIELANVMVGDEYWINYNVKQIKIMEDVSDHTSIFDLVNGNNDNNNESVNKVQLVTETVSIPQAPTQSIPSSTVPLPVAPSLKSESKSSFLPKFIVSTDDIKEQLLKMRERKLDKCNQEMTQKVNNMKNDIIAFKHSNKIIDQKYKECCL